MLNNNEDHSTRDCQKWHNLIGRMSPTTCNLIILVSKSIFTVMSSQQHVVAEKNKRAKRQPTNR